MAPDALEAKAAAPAATCNTISSMQLRGSRKRVRDDSRDDDEREAKLQQMVEVECSRRLAEMRQPAGGQREAAAHSHNTRGHDSKMFSFSVRGCSGPQLSGCLPKEIFQAEPNSALANMYNGNWECAKDSKGRAIVNSSPINWPIIVDWLSFGTIPCNPPDGLVSECRYWQLEGLLRALDAQAKPERVFGGCMAPVGESGEKVNMTLTSARSLRALAQGSTSTAHSWHLLSVILANSNASAWSLRPSVRCTSSAWSIQQRHQLIVELG